MSVVKRFSRKALNLSIYIHHIKPQPISQCCKRNKLSRKSLVDLYARSSFQTSNILAIIWGYHSGLPLFSINKNNTFKNKTHYIQKPSNIRKKFCPQLSAPFK